MKNIVNDTSAYADEAVEGLCGAFPQYYRFAKESRRVIVRADGPVEGKVAVVSGGGSGHLPLFAG